MAGERDETNITYNDIDANKVINKAGLLELSGQIKGYIQANTPSTVLTSQVDTGKVDQTTNNPIFLDDYLDDLETAISNTTTYTLPTASTSTLGGVKVDGSTITIDQNGVISSSGGGSSYTFTNGLTESNGVVSYGLYNKIQLQTNKNLAIGGGGVNNSIGNNNLILGRMRIDVWGNNGVSIGGGDIRGNSSTSIGIGSRTYLPLGISIGPEVETNTDKIGYFPLIFGVGFYNNVYDKLANKKTGGVWENTGDLLISGDLYIGCNDFTTRVSNNIIGPTTAHCGGSKVATEAYVDSKIPAAPANDGTYMLKCVVSNGEPTYSWESVSVEGN